MCITGSPQYSTALSIPTHSTSLQSKGTPMVSCYNKTHVVVGRTSLGSVTVISISDRLREVVAPCGRGKRDLLHSLKGELPQMIVWVKIVQKELSSLIIEG